VTSSPLQFDDVTGSTRIAFFSNLLGVAGAREQLVVDGLDGGARYTMRVFAIDGNRPAEDVVMAQAS
jgi:hypothetical protein